MIEKILAIFQSYQVNEENQAGTKGNVIWEDDFLLLTADLAELLQKSRQPFVYMVATNNGQRVDSYWWEHENAMKRVKVLNDDPDRFDEWFCYPNGVK